MGNTIFVFECCRRKRNNSSALFTYKFTWATVYWCKAVTKQNKFVVIFYMVDCIILTSIGRSIFIPNMGGLFIYVYCWTFIFIHIYPKHGWFFSYLSQTSSWNINVGSFQQNSLKRSLQTRPLRCPPCAAARPRTWFTTFRMVSGQHTLPPTNLPGNHCWNL